MLSKKSPIQVFNESLRPFLNLVQAVFELGCAVGRTRNGLRVLLNNNLYCNRSGNFSASFWGCHDENSKNRKKTKVHLAWVLLHKLHLY